MSMSRKLLLQPQYKFDKQVWSSAGTYNQISFPTGLYLVETHGGGGAGGDGGASGYRENTKIGTGGQGGAGGKGYYAGLLVKITTPAQANLRVGAGGGRGTGGNGGAGGRGYTKSTSCTGSGGYGGGAGYASYVSFYGGLVHRSVWIAFKSAAGETWWYNTETNSGYTLSVPGFQPPLYSAPVSGSTPAFSVVGKVVERWKTIDVGGTIFTLDPSQTVWGAGWIFGSAGGGGGGGGGGGVGAARVYSDQSTNGGGGAGGGGGGGSRTWNRKSYTSLWSEQSLAGKVGSKCGASERKPGTPGVAGYTGNYYPEENVAGSSGATSGTGGTSYDGGSAAGASGWGASGASGAAPKANDGSWYSRPIGGGGGGARGISAFGGNGGVRDISASYGGNGGNASRPGRTPDTTYNNNGQVAAAGSWGGGGTGGAAGGGALSATTGNAGTVGGSGWIQIARLT